MLKLIGSGLALRLVQKFGGVAQVGAVPTALIAGGLKQISTGRRRVPAGIAMIAAASILLVLEQNASKRRRVVKLVRQNNDLADISPIHIP
jgi:MFS-type transporter involved in bile tolerance (Atg22 family)